MTAAAPVAFTGVVLCGGASRRMGRDKALIEVDGRAMAVRVAAALHEAGAAEVLAVGGDAGALAVLGLDVRPDRWPGEGPLPATVTALGEAQHDIVLVTSCDLLHPSPAAMASTVAALAAHPRAVAAVPVVDGQRQWVHAAWRSVARHALIASYDRGLRSLRRAARGLDLAEVTDVEPGALADADDPADLP